MVSEHRSVTSELKLLNTVKLMLTDCFKLCSDDEFSFEQKCSILVMQKECLTDLVQSEHQMSGSTQNFIDDYVAMLQEKIAKF